MMTASCLFLFLLVIYTSAGVTSAGTKLSLNVIHDVNFTCAVEGFEGKMASLLKLEIVKKTVQGGDVVLASVNHDGIRSRLRALEQIHPFHEVSGNFNFMRKQNSWLKLAVFQFDPFEDGDYACRVQYLDHLADTEASTMEATLPVNTTRQFGTLLESEQRAGFTLWLRRSVQAVCEYETEERHDLSLPATVYLLENNTTVLASWEKDNGRFELENRSLTVSAQPPRMETDRRFVFEVRVFDISCAKPWKCSCVCQQEVHTSPSPSIFSFEQELPHQCKDVLNDTASLQEPAALDLSNSPQGMEDAASDKNYASLKMNDAPADIKAASMGTKQASRRGTDDAPLHHFTVGLFVSIAVAVVVLALVGFVVYRLRKSKRACFKIRGDADDTACEVNEPLNGHLGSGTRTEDIELNKDMDRMSMTSLASNKLSVHSSVGSLGLKLRSDASFV